MAERRFSNSWSAGSDQVIWPDAMEADAECFRREGHSVTFWRIPGLGHGWCSQHDFNDRLWRFLSVLRLPTVQTGK